MNQEGKMNLYVVVCGATPATHIHEFLMLALQNAWDVYVIATPAGMNFIDQERVESLTGHPIASDYRMPDQEKSLPLPNAIVLAPATFNTINKWALGIADTYATGILCEYLSQPIPIVAVPYMKDELARHPAIAQNIQMIKQHGVTIIHDAHKVVCSTEINWKKVIIQLDSLAAKHISRRKRTGKQVISA